MKKYMLDTNSFDYILDKNLEIKTLTKKGKFYTTNVQFSELSNIPNEERRTKLLALYKNLPQEKLQLRSWLWLDKLCWDDDKSWIDEVTQDFELFLNGNINNAMDALIGELAKHNEIILITSDIKLIKKCNKFNVNNTNIE